MAVKAEDIVILLGAGCSADAGIPTATDMVAKIETQLAQANREQLRRLYNYIKSALLYGRGIQGQFGASLNIEELLATLSELEKKERNIIFPFIANWNDLLAQLAGTDFKSISELKKLINDSLREWVRRDNYLQQAEYYGRFYDFQKGWQFPLRVFTLNYDQCFEKLCPSGMVLEQGFDENTKKWQYQRFEPDENRQVDVYLYKLHGSINWKREDDILVHCDELVESPELIFGLTGKLQSYDPYLFYVYELRNYSLDCKIILVIGYGFGDDHINQLLKQALQQNPGRKIVCITGADSNHGAEEKAKADRTRIASLLGCTQDDRVIVHAANSNDFLNNQLSAKFITELLPDTEAGAPF